MKVFLMIIRLIVMINIEIMTENELFYTSYSIALTKNPLQREMIVELNSNLSEDTS